MIDARPASAESRCDLAGPTFLSLINYLIPLWAVVVGIVFLGEKPDWNAIFALVLILAGIALSQRGTRQSP